MNILFLTLMRIDDFNLTGIYPDLINEFATQGHDIYVVSPCENKNKKNYMLIRKQGRINLISALIPDYFGVGLVKKGYSSIVIGQRYVKAIKKATNDVKFDMILYSTPPITFCSVIEKYKQRDTAFTYLLLKDIWPQGPIDVGALSEKGIRKFVTKYFKKKEKKLYELSDFIGCMSLKNCQYLVEKSGVNENKVEECPNSIKIRECARINKGSIREKYRLPINKTIFVYGGNLGVAQGVDFIISCLELNENKENSFILIIGAGTEYDRLMHWLEQRKPQNCRLISQLPPNEYMELMASCDVGLVFLDHRFTIPNFPSRILSYMEAKMPVLAATDPNTDIGTTIEAGGFGYWCESNDANSFISLMDNFTNEVERRRMGEQAYEYLKKHYDVSLAYDRIIAHIRL